MLDSTKVSPLTISAWKVLAAIAGIYISQTIITSLVTQALPVLLRNEGASLQLVGLTSLLWIPWSIRFLWAPTIERWRLPSGTRERHSRKLILIGQWFIAFILFVLGLFSLNANIVLVAHFGWILGGLVCAALVASTTDIASDGFTIEQLSIKKRGWGNVMQVGGSYVGAMLGAGGFLLIAGRFGWPQAFLGSSLIIVLLSVPMMMLREPARNQNLMVGHKPNVLSALRRSKVRIGLVLIVFSSIGIRLTLGMFGPFLIDRGLTIEQLGCFFGTLHLVAGLSGAVLGGILVSIMHGWKGVWVALSFKVFILIILTLVANTASLPILMILIGMMFAALGFVWVPLYSALMGLTSPLQPGVDFTLFQSVDALIAVIGGVLGGWLSQHLGYEFCFGLAACSTIIAIFVVKSKAHSLEEAKEYTYG